MSQIYNLEPQPTGSVILHTTQGELSVELFAKQTPLTCRNFLQLCTDGYYDNTIFHRLVPGFILQGGDPTGTGNGGESIYDGGAFSGEFDPWPMEQRTGKNAGKMGIGFRDEFHSRLKFNRRGLLGMANEGTPNTNGSQFFFTLAKADELNSKNTVFGRIAGDTIYNLAKMAEAEVQEGTDRPTYPVKITRVEILVNPFEGMQRRARATAVAAQPQKTVLAERKKKRKGGKQLLSFADEEGEEEETPILKKAKFDTRIAVAAEDDEPAAVKPKPPKPSKPPKKVLLSDEDEIPQPKDKPAKDKAAKPLREDSDVDMEDGRRERSVERSLSPEPAPKSKKTALERTNEEIAALKASMRRTVHSEPVAQEVKKSALERMIPETSTRGKKRGTGGKINVSDADDQRTLNMLLSFQSKLNQAAPSKMTSSTPAVPGEDDDDKDGPGQQGADEEAQLCDLHFIPNCQSCQSWDAKDKGEESDDEGWMSHALSFQADRLGKDLSNRRKAEEELVVIDPRERERTLKEEKRAERQAKAGNSGREWDKARDRARNAELSRLSSLAGRGAK